MSPRRSPTSAAAASDDGREPVGPLTLIADDLPEPGRPALELDDVNMQFGGVHALAHVSLTVTTGQIFGIIGLAGTSLLIVQHHS